MTPRNCVQRRVRALLARMQSGRQCSILAMAGFLAGALLLLAGAGPILAQGDTPTPVDEEPTPCAELPPGAIEEALTVFHVAINTPAQLRRLDREFDLWLARPNEGYALVGGSLQTLAELHAAGYQVAIDSARTEEVHTALTSVRTALCDGAPDSQGAQPASLEQSQQAPGIPGFPCYRTAREVENALYALAAAYPTLATVVDIGDSWEKAAPAGAPGHDLLALRVTNSRIAGPKFPFALVAAIHARELTTAESALRFAEQLLTTYGVDPEATWLLDHGVLHLLPIVNPDGREIAESGLLWRKNTHFDGLCGPPGSSRPYGVDLNRNSSFAWNGCTTEDCSSEYSCSLTYRGASAGSEPETAAIEKYLGSVLADQRGAGPNDAAPAATQGIFISLHSFGELVLYPWAYTDALPPNGDGLAAIGRRFSGITSYRSCQTGSPDCLYGADGTTDDWVYGTLGVPAFTIEMGLSFFESCTTYEQVVRRPVQRLLRDAFTIAHAPYQMAQGPTVQLAQPAGAAAQVASGDAEWLELSVIAGEPFTLAATVAPAVGPGATPAVVTGTALTAEWSLDLPPWAADVRGTLAPANGGRGAVQAVISSAGWKVGRHLLFVQGYGTDGTAGAPEVLYVDVQAPGGVAPPPTPTPPAPPVVPLPVTPSPPTGPVQPVYLPLAVHPARQ